MKLPPVFRDESGSDSFSKFVVPMNPVMYMNPRHVWCYSGEDFMGKVRPLAASSTQGNTMWGVSAKATEKYVRALDMTLRDPALWLRNLN